MFPEDRFVEILIIGALALIVIGPKDLPVLMRRIGQFVGRMRNMAAEFRASFDELARQSELDELRRQVEALRHNQDITPPATPPAAPEATPPPMMQLTPPMSHQIAAPAPVEAPDAPPGEPEAAPKPKRKSRAKAAKAAGEAS
jgi:sec-independent protein translocase protein TatB